MTALLGRVAVAAIFLVSGTAKLVDVAGTASYMTAAGIPYPETLAMFAGAVEVLGAVSLIFGALTRVGALGLLVFLIPTTLLPIRRSRSRGRSPGRSDRAHPP